MAGIEGCNKLWYWAAGNAKERRMATWGLLLRSIGLVENLFGARFEFSRMEEAGKKVIFGEPPETCSWDSERKATITTTLPLGALRIQSGSKFCDPFDPPSVVVDGGWKGGGELWPQKCVETQENLTRGRWQPLFAITLFTCGWKQAPTLAANDPAPSHVWLFGLRGKNGVGNAEVPSSGVPEWKPGQHVFFFFCVWQGKHWPLWAKYVLQLISWLCHAVNAN